jgi:Arc/MetJ-type ribon-helix-helix transcriptional regulator
MAEEKMKLMNFRMPPDEADKVERAAKTVPYRNVSDFIREAIREKMEREAIAAAKADQGVA